MIFSCSAKDANTSISDNHIKDDQIKKYLIEFGLFHILSDFIQDSKDKKQVKIIEAVQKIRNEKILSEIEVFASFHFLFFELLQ